MPVGRAAHGAWGREAAVWPLMLFGFASRQEFWFIGAWGPTRVAHPLKVSIIGAIGHELSVSHGSGLTMLSDIGSFSFTHINIHAHTLCLSHYIIPLFTRICSLAERCSLWIQIPSFLVNIPTVTIYHTTLSTVYYCILTTVCSSVTVAWLISIAFCVVAKYFCISFAWFLFILALHWVALQAYVSSLYCI